MSKKIVDENFESEILFFADWRDFRGATAERTSKSASSSNFALDRLIQRSVRPKNLGFGEILGPPKNFHPMIGVRFRGGIKSTASHR